MSVSFKSRPKKKKFSGVLLVEGPVLAIEMSERSVIVVGSGIAGLSCALHLCKHGGGKLRVTLLEGAEELGGHSKTVEHRGELVDLGFQVFNRETYPMLCEVYRELAITPVASEMSFATELDGSCVKYSADLRPFVSW